MVVPAARPRRGVPTPVSAHKTLPAGEPGGADPILDREGYGKLMLRIAEWLRVAEQEGYGSLESVYHSSLLVEMWHSGALYRLLVEGKPLFVKPPASFSFGRRDYAKAERQRRKRRPLP